MNERKYEGRELWPLQGGSCGGLWSVSPRGTSGWDHWIRLWLDKERGPAETKCRGFWRQKVLVDCEEVA